MAGGVFIDRRGRVQRRRTVCSIVAQSTRRVARCEVYCRGASRCIFWVCFGGPRVLFVFVDLVDWLQAGQGSAGQGRAGQGSTSGTGPGDGDLSRREGEERLPLSIHFLLLSCLVGIDFSPLDSTPVPLFFVPSFPVSCWRVFLSCVFFIMCV